MFDKKPITAGERNAAAFNLQDVNNGIRGAFYYIDQIYDPDKHSPDDIEKYIVPRVGCLVFDVPNGIIYKVNSVAENLKSTLERWYVQSSADSNVSDSIHIFGQPGGFNQGERVLAVDYSVLPNKAVIDKRILCPDADYALLYLGSVFGDEQKIISATYANRNEMTSKRINLTLAAIDNRLNRTIKTTEPFSVTMSQEELPPGSRTTLAFYKEDGTLLPPTYILGTQHTAYLRDHNIGTRFVTTIELLTPWFTDSNQTDLLLVPINFPIKQVVFRAKVNYSNGDSEVLPVDGTRFKLFGIEQFKPTSVGDTTGELVLVYTLSEGEQVFLAKPGAPKSISKTYLVQASLPEGCYTPKIYTYPVPKPSSGYGLKHFLYTLDRNEVVDVTEVVKLNNQSPAFDPTGYGYVQRLIFNLRLSDANPIYADWTVAQTTAITLKVGPTDDGAKWNVNYNNTVTMEGYTSEPAVIYDNTINLNHGKLETQQAWLDKLYKPVMPLYQPEMELLPQPTHFEIWDVDGEHWRFPLDRWNFNNTITKAYANGDTLFIRWIKANGDGSEQQLAMTGVYVLNSTKPVIPDAKFGFDIENTKIQGWERGVWDKES